MRKSGRGRKPTLHSRPVALVAIGVSGAVVLAGCSNSNDSASGSPRKGNGSAGCIKAVGGLVAEHVASGQQNWYPPAHSNVASVKGKTYWLITLNSAIPTLAQFAAGFQAAATAAGAKSVVFDGKSSPAVWSQGVNAAVAAHAAGIVLSAVDPAYIGPALATAFKAHVPVINAENGNPKPPFAPDITADVSQDANKLGAWLADGALKTTRCAMHAIYPNTRDVGIAVQIFNAVKAETSRLCPTCVITEMDINSGDLPTKLTSTLETLVRTHPDTNIIIDSNDVLDPFVEAGLKALGKSTPVINTASMGDLAGKPVGPLVGTIVYANPQVHGWFYMDAVLRVASGEKSVSLEYPIGMLDQSNWSSSDPTSYAQNPPYEGYEAKFMSLWGK